MLKNVYKLIEFSYLKTIQLKYIKNINKIF